MAVMKKEMGCNCPHHKFFGWLVLVVGVLYLLQDLKLISFWNINWWTVAFLVVGFGGMCKCCGMGKCM